MLVIVSAPIAGADFLSRLAFGVSLSLPLAPRLLRLSQVLRA